MMPIEDSMRAADIKDFYQTYGDRIVDKRLNSPYPLRRYAHRMGYETIARLVKPGDRVLDAGCGEGVLSWYLAEQGATVTAMDISRPNLENAKADRKSTRLNSSHIQKSRMPSSA